MKRKLPRSKPGNELSGEPSSSPPCSSSPSSLSSPPLASPGSPSSPPSPPSPSPPSPPSPSPDSPGSVGGPTPEDAAPPPCSCARSRRGLRPRGVLVTTGIKIGQPRQLFVITPVAGAAIGDRGVARYARRATAAARSAAAAAGTGRRDRAAVADACWVRNPVGRRLAGAERFLQIEGVAARVYLRRHLGARERERMGRQASQRRRQAIGCAGMVADAGRVCK